MKLGLRSGSLLPGRPSLALLPGLGVVAAIAVVAWLVAALLPFALGAVPVAVVLGVALRASLGDHAGWLDAGAGFATKRILRLGIVLLGARLGLGDVVDVGVLAAVAVVVTVSTGFLAAWWIGRLLRLDADLAALLGVGSAICGNTAILATAPSIGARERSVGVAVGTITAFGTVAVIVYPLLAAWLALGPVAAGLLAGLAVQDTSQVVATGAAIGDDALDVATIVKLVRNGTLAIVLPLVAAWWHRPGAGRVERGSSGDRRGGQLRWSTAFPPFVAGFLALVLLRTVGVLPEAWGDRIGGVSAPLILLAVAGLGLSVRWTDLRAVGPRPLVAGGAAALALAGLALLAGLVV